MPYGTYEVAGYLPAGSSIAPNDSICSNLGSIFMQPVTIGGPGHTSPLLVNGNATVTGITTLQDLHLPGHCKPVGRSMQDQLELLQHWQTLVLTLLLLLIVIGMGPYQPIRLLVGISHLAAVAIHLRMRTSDSVTAPVAGASFKFSLMFTSATRRSLHQLLIFRDLPQLTRMAWSALHPMRLPAQPLQQVAVER